MIDDLVYFVGALFVIAIVIITGYVAFDGLYTGINESTTIAQEHKNFLKGQFDRYENLDYSFLFIFVCVFIAILLLSWILATYPAMFIVFFFMVIILSGLAGILANAWIDISADTVLGAAMTNFPIMSFIMENYLLFIAITTITMIIVFFAKPNNGGIA